MESFRLIFYVCMHMNTIFFAVVSVVILFHSCVSMHFSILLQISWPEPGYLHVKHLGHEGAGKRAKSGSICASIQQLKFTCRYLFIT